jgi:5-methylcytosine-specific restriction endonuclease McrA
MGVLTPSKPCPGRGKRNGHCGTLIEYRERYCSVCLGYAIAENREYDKQRDQSEGRKLIHSALWRKVRTAKLAHDPLCERHLASDRVVVAVLVHHKDHDELNWADENLESLCNDCHEEEHGPDRFKRRV